MKKHQSMTLVQQGIALGFLKESVDQADEQASGPLGYDDHVDTMKLRLFLIEVGHIPDRRE